jgi:long-chain acyl-CoA synthetase
MSVSEANARLAIDPRFGTEPINAHGRQFQAWINGPRHLADVFDLCLDHGDADFLVLGEQRASYRGFTNAVAFGVNRLRIAGIAPGDRVALLMRNRLEWPVCFFSIVLAGGIVVPINGWAGAEHVAAMLNDVSPTIVITEDGAPDLHAVEGRTWSIDDPEPFIPAPEQWASLPLSDLELTERDPDSVAAIFFTSGTTGMPKGAMTSHRAIAGVVRNAEFQRARLELRYPNLVRSSRTQATLFPVPLFHVTGAIAGLISFAANGAKLVLMPKWDARTALSLIEREEITLVGGVPTLPLQMLEEASLSTTDVSSLEMVLYGGAPPPRHLPRAIAEALDAEAATGWGMTETSATFLYNAGPDYLRRPASCGLVAPVNAARIMLESGEEAPIGTSGELQVRGQSLTMGYWQRPEATEDAFDGDWFKTGDLAVVDEDGFFTILDRLKDVIIRGGENIPSVVLEDAIIGHPAVAECAVVGRPHATLGEEPIAVVRFIAGMQEDLGAVLDHAGAQLPKHMRPVACLAVKEPLPRNPGGKILKPLVRDLVDAAFRDKGHVAEVSSVKGGRIGQ